MNSFKVIYFVLLAINSSMPRFSSITTGAVIGIANSTGDPFLTPLYNVSYGEATDDNFGWDVVTNGNLVLVADRSGPSASFKVKLLNARTGSLIYNIADPAPTLSNQFNRLALTNKYFIVGDPGFRGPSNESNRGKVYYYRIDTGELRNSIQLPDGFWNANDRLGDAVAANDQYLVVSVPGANKTYIFDIETGTNTAPGLPADGIDDATSNAVHKCLSIHDNYLAIGGRIYSTSDWSLVRTIVDSSGRTVMSNGYLAHYVPGAQSRVDVYSVETGALLYSLVAPNGGAGFGERMSINDSVIAIYQVFVNDIFVYDLFSGTLIDRVASSKDTGVGQFGYQISLSNRYLVITDALDDDSGVINKGRIYTYATKRKSTRWGINIDQVGSINEGQNINISFTAASDIPDGSIVNYNIVGAGLNPKDVGEIVSAQIPITRRRGTLTIPIFDDSTTEGIERMNVIVSTPAGVVLLDRTLTINDTSTTPTDSFVRYIEPPPEALDLLVGATTQFGVDGIASNSGYLFVGVGNGNPNFEQNRAKGLVLVYDIANFELLQVIRPTEPSASLSDLFGCAIACTEDHVIIGARGGFYAETWRLIDGRWQFKWRVTEGGGSGSFGTAVDINDTYAVVGAPSNILPGVNPGKVSVYNVSTGSLRGDIRNPDSQSDQFGASVAITANGTQAYVGAPLAEDTGEATNSGKVYLINLSTADYAGASERPADYTDITSYLNQQFGFSIAIDGRGEFIASPQHRTAATGVVGGGIYRSDLRGALTAKVYDDAEILNMLTNSDQITGVKARNGYLLAHGGNRSFLMWWKGNERYLEEYSLQSSSQSATLSDRYAILGDTDNRRIAVYRLRSPFGTLVQPPQQRLESTIVPNPQEGLSGSISDDYYAENITSAVVPNIGNFVAVSAPGEDAFGTGDNRGFIYIYRFNESQGAYTRLFSMGPPTVLDPTPNNDAFGEYMVSNSRRLVVGHRQSDPGGAISGGTIYGYTWNASSMSTPTYTINNPNNGLFWGQRISISEQYLVVGNPDYDSGPLTGQSNNGRVWVYDALDGTELYQIPTPTQTTNFQFGESVAVSDSGYLAVGRPNDNGGSGRVYVYQLGESSATLLYELAGTAADQFGSWLKITDNYLLVGNEPTNTISGGINIYRVTDGTLMHSNSWSTINSILGEDLSDNVSRLGNYFRTRSPVALTDRYFAVGFVRARKYTDGVVLVWNVEDGELVSVIGNPDTYLLYTPTSNIPSLFGGAVDILGNQLFIGAVGEPLFSNPSSQNVGQLYIFDLP